MLSSLLSAQMVRRSVVSLALACAVITSGCGGSAASGGKQSSTAKPTSLSIAPATVSQPAGSIQQFTATAMLGDGTTRDVTAQSEWASNDGTIAAVTKSGGIETALIPGDVTISATFTFEGITVTASAALHVTAAEIRSIAVAPAIAQLELGANQQFTATATFTDGTTRDVTRAVSWSSSDQAVLRVNTEVERVGLANTRGPGSVTITATLNSSSGSTPVTVLRRIPKFLYAAGIFGINGYAISPATGALRAAGAPFTAVGAISSLSISRDRRFLYAADSALGVIWALQIDASGALAPVPNSPFSTSATSSPVSVVADPTADFLFVTDADTGEISTCVIASDGSLAIVASTPFISPQLLFAEASPDGRFFYQGAHVGSDATITGFSITSNGALSAVPGSPAATEFIPKTLTVDPSGRFLYVVISSSSLGLSTSVVGFNIDSQDGVLTPITGSPFTAGENPSSADVDASGRFLYVANAANSADGNSISAFTIDVGSGTLANVPGSPFSAASSPLTVTVEPGAQFAYVGLDGNQGVRAFAIDQHTGALTEIPGSPFPANGAILALAATY